jgi:hypothetical protein
MVTDAAVVNEVIHLKSGIRRISIIMILEIIYPKKGEMRINNKMESTTLHTLSKIFPFGITSENVILLFFLKESRINKIEKTPSNPLSHNGKNPGPGPY